MSPRDRIVPDDQMPGEPTELSFEDAERLREKRAKKSAEYDQGAGHRSSSGRSFGAQRGRHSDSRDNNRTRKGAHESVNSPATSIKGNIDPWAKSKNKSEP